MRVEISGSGKLTDHFSLKEFCHHDKYIYIDERFFSLVNILEKFRGWYNRPINISSAYRPAAYNKKVGGASNSSHLFTGAIDFSLPADYYSMTAGRKEAFLNNVKNKWVELCEEAGYFPQVNFYDTYLHIGISTNNSSFLDKRTKK